MTDLNKADEKPEDIKVHQYQELALRIKEINKRLAFLEENRGHRLSEIETKVEALESDMIKPYQRELMDKVDAGIEDFRQRLEAVENINSALSQLGKNIDKFQKDNPGTPCFRNICHKCGGTTIGDLKGEPCWECKHPEVKPVPSPIKFTDCTGLGITIKPVPSDSITIKRSTLERWLSDAVSWNQIADEIKSKLEG